MSDNEPQPDVDIRGVPYCSADCRHHDGKRCRLLGFRPGNICEPAVIAMAETIEEWRQSGIERGLRD